MGRLVGASTSDTQLLLSASKLSFPTMGRWTSSKLTSLYELHADHRMAAAGVIAGMRVSSIPSVSWGPGSKHDPLAEVPSAVYRTLYTHGGPMSLGALLDAVKTLLPHQEGKAPEAVLCDFLRELHKQGMITMVSKGTL